MTVVADRFLVDGRDTIDLATGEHVGLSTDAAPDRHTTQARTALCDRLASLRHPLLRPLLDYGVAHGSWFEAHAPLPPLRASGTLAQRTAQHLGRFLNAAGIAMSQAVVDRNVRATSGGSAMWRPIGLHLVPRASLDTIQTLLEASGPPGLIRVEVYGVPGSGMRTTRLAVARAARLAGLIPIDASLIAHSEEIRTLCRGRHLCAIDWAAGDLMSSRVPAAAAVAGPGRHFWLRFRRGEPPAGAIALERFTTAELCAMVYVDHESGPGAADVRAAAISSDGLPGKFVERLSSPTGPRHALWVHETAPEYVVRRTPRPDVLAPACVSTGGVARLERLVTAARALGARGRHARAERVLQRAATALAARHATRAAALAACDLGDLVLGRGRADKARSSFAQAREWCSDPDVSRRCVIGTGRALLDLGQLPDAEAAFRTAMAAGNPPGENEPRRLLAETLLVRGDLDAAREALSLGPDDRDPRALAVASEIARRRGDLGRAGRLAAAALAQTPPGDHVSACEAHLSSMHVQAALRNRPDVERHARAAAIAGRSAKLPGLVLKAAADGFACLASCGVEGSTTRGMRLLAAAQRLPLLRAAQIRAAVCGIDPEVRRVASRIGALSLVEPNGHRRSAVDMLEDLLHVTHEAPDDAAALRGVAEHLMQSLDACSITIRAAEPRRQLAAAGRPWPHDAVIAERALDGGAGVFRDGPAPEAAEPIRAAGATLGCIAARWVAGTRPVSTRITESLRLAAAASAPIVRGFAVCVPQPPGPHADEVLGPGPAAEAVRAAIRRAAVAPYPVLIEGESGSGKEVVARAIHTRGLRRARRFCAINCAALTDDLLEAELFGHARGAFTGAVVERAGLFEEADQGTLFLDEVAELSPRAQAKLLRVLQEGEVRRVGENHPRRVDARIVAASNRSLEAETGAGRFRVDLRFRLDVIRIRIPPLRERPDDVPWLATTIWADAARRVGTRATLSPELVSALARYDWPGNVRELQNVIAALAVHAPPRGRVGPSLLPPHVAGIAARAATSFDAARAEFERRFVRAALARAGGRKAQAARQLGVSRQGLSKMMKRLGLLEPAI